MFLELNSIFFLLDASRICSEYTSGISQFKAASLDIIDTFHEFSCHSHMHSCELSTNTLSKTLPRKCKLLQRNRIENETHFKNADRSKLIGIPLTRDGALQIIADKETNL